MCKILLPLKLLVNADIRVSWQFGSKTELMFYTFSPSSLYIKRSGVTGQNPSKVIYDPSETM